MLRRTPMSRGTALRPMSAKREQEMREAGIRPVSTFRTRAPFEAVREAMPRPVYTGPKRSVCELVDIRSDRICEWPDCWSPQDHRHHRLNRKNGGRHGEMRERLNSPAWLLGACWLHHDIVTNPVGDVRVMVEQMGWVLREHQDAIAVPVWTRHCGEPVWLDNAGAWWPYEAGAA